MGSVVALDQFRETIEYRKSQQSRPPRPQVLGSEIWGRDYRQVEAIVFGLLKVRAILAYHSGAHDHVFDHLCVACLEAAYMVQEKGTNHLKYSVKPLKEWILDTMHEENKRDYSWALIIIDLIEKSPTK